MRKKINPTKALVNGEQVIATALTVEGAKDDLFGNAVFRCTYWTETGIWAGEAAVRCTYTAAEATEVKSTSGNTVVADWDASPEGAYIIAAACLGLEFQPVVGSRFFEI
jgi:hypothetical protein